MTVADHKSSEKPSSWLARMRAAAPARLPPAGSVPITQKPLDDMADLLVMSTVDQKVPAESPGSADLMDALVQQQEQDAELTAERMPPAEEIAPTEEPVAGAAERAIGSHASNEPELSSEQRVDLLQREIETLLRDTPEVAPEESPPAPWPEEALRAVAPMPIGEPPIEMPAETENISAEPPRPNISAAELDVLLEREAQVQVADAMQMLGETPAMMAVQDMPVPLQTVKPLAEAVPDASPLETPVPVAGAAGGAVEGVQTAANISEKIFAEQLDRLMASASVRVPEQKPVDDTRDKLSEAEGVLAEELAQLISETLPAAEPKTDQAGAAAAVPLSVPGTISSADEKSNEAVAPTAVAAAAEPATAATAEALAAETAVATEPVSPAREPMGLLARIRKIVAGIMLMILQLFDLPFGWIPELDKNIIGLAALLLLLGGCVLYVMSRIT